MSRKYTVQHCINVVQTFILSVSLLTSKIGKWGPVTPCIGVLRQAVAIGIFKPRRISAGIPTPYTPDWIVPDYDFLPLCPLQDLSDSIQAEGPLSPTYQRTTRVYRESIGPSWYCVTFQADSSLGTLPFGEAILEN
jgi:hypothetical protein